MTKHHHAPVLCVTDLKEQAAAVLRMAADLAVRYKEDLQILFPYRMQADKDSTDLIRQRRQLEQTGRERITALLDDMNYTTRVLWEFHPEIGFPAQRIKSKLREGNFSFVIISEEQLKALEDGDDLVLPAFIHECNIPFVVVPAAQKVFN